LLEPGRLQRIAAPLLPVLALVVWYVVAGRAQGFGVNPLSGTGFSLLAGFAGYGVAAAGTAASGFGSALTGWPVLVALVIEAGRGLFGWWRRLESTVLGASAGIGAAFITAGLAQQQIIERNEAGANRYMYVGVAMLLLLVTSAVARLRWRPVVAFAVIAFAS